MKVFSPAEVSRAKKELKKESLGILPVSVDTDGYYYDPSELFAALQKIQNIINDSCFIRRFSGIILWIDLLFLS